MRQFKVLLLLIAISCSMFAQDRLSLFIGRANKYASVELSDYRKRLCIEYNTPNNLLDDYYRQCGRDWGNVGLALEIAKTSGRHMRDVCDYYKRYHRHGWDRVLIEIGIRPGSVYYNPFYDRVNYHSNCWHEHYCSYCDHHRKHHHKHYKKHKKHKHNKHYRWDDDDDDDWDDEDWDNDDWDDEDDELVDDNRAVESFGSWILNLTGLKSEPAGTESCIIPYPASEAASLKLELEDNVKAHLLQPDGSYEKVDKRGKVLVNSQDQFCEEAIEMAKACQESKDPAVTRIFQPIESSNE